MRISCAFAPSPDAVEHIVEAERLGYERAWLYDSPALYGDVWMIGALAAVRPGASCSRVAMALAWVSGWRRFGTSTAGPRPMRDVRAAARAPIIQTSP